MRATYSRLTAGVQPRRPPLVLIIAGIIFFVGVCAVVVSLTVTAAHRTSSGKGPTPNPPHPPCNYPGECPPMPDEGVYCTLTPAAMSTWNATCPTMANSTFCDAWSNATSQACIFEVCTLSVFGTSAGISIMLTLPGDLNAALYYPVAIRGQNATIQLPALIAKFQEDNVDLTADPQPFDAAANFTAADYSNTSFATSATELARSSLAAQWSIVWIFARDLNATLELVYVPARCPASAGLGNMTWLDGNDIPVYGVNALLRCLLGFDLAGEPGSNETLFQEMCTDCMDNVVAHWADPCAIFESAGPYPWADLADYAAATSFWRDMRTLSDLYTSTFFQCGLNTTTAPCFGVGTL
jgi:hypothetical protein